MSDLLLELMMEPLQETRPPERATDPRFPREDCTPCMLLQCPDCGVLTQRMDVCGTCGYASLERMRLHPRSTDRPLAHAGASLCPRCRRCRGHVACLDAVCDDCGETN